MTDKFSRKAHNFNHVILRGYYMYCLLEREKLRVFMKNSFVPFVQLPEETTINFYTALVSWPLLEEERQSVYCEVRTIVLKVYAMKFLLQVVSLRLLTLDVQVPSLEFSCEIHGGLSDI
jgi:predicted transcriptional regulator of viral defense system